MSTPYPYQEEGIRLITSPIQDGGFDGRAYLADEMGLGKSLQALVSASRMNWFPMIVVCPPSLRYNWQRECQKHLGLRAEILQGTKAPSNRLGLRKDIHPPVHIIGDHADTLNAWMTHLQLLSPKLIVVDECHRISNRESRRSQLVKELGEGIPKAICLSGTPLPNRPADLWNVLNFLWPEEYPSFYQYALRYCDLKKMYGHWTYRGAKNLPELHKKLKAIGMIRRRKLDVFSELPELRRIVLPIPIEDRSQYQNELSSLIKAFKSIGSNNAVTLTKINELKQSVGRKKMPYVIEWIEEFLKESDGKLLVFGIHHEVMEALHNKFLKNSVLIYGKKNHQDRLRDEDSFQNDKRIRICFGNIHAAGVGLNLTAAHTVAVVEYPWKPSDLEQAIARAFGRVSDLHGVDAYYLTGIGTIDEHIVDLLDKKQRCADAVVDGYENASDFDIADQLISILKEEQK